MPRAKSTGSKRRVPLLVKDAKAKEVRVAGDFNDWSDKGTPLSPDGEGRWRVDLPLAPGKYQYRLLVDGDWRDHTEATERVENPFGSKNCILKVD